MNIKLDGPLYGCGKHYYSGATPCPQCNTLPASALNAVPFVHELRLTKEQLRDWFAGQALAGLLACPDASNNTQIIVKACYHVADAMLKAREQREEVAK